MATKIASRKAKGRALQQFVAKKISEILGIPCGKDTEITSREMSQSGTDVRLSERVESLFPFSVECKNVEALNLWSAIDQAKANQKLNTSWLLFCKRNRIDPVVVMDADEWFDMYHDALLYNIEHYKK